MFRVVLENFKKWFKSNYFNLLLGLVIVFAFVLRYVRTNLGLPYTYYWDEYQVASNAIKIMKTGDFNPHFFIYGSLMIYLNLIVDVIHYLFLMSQPYNTLTSPNDIKIFTDTHWRWTISHPEFYHWNRVLTVFFSILSIVYLYKLVKLVTKDKWVAFISMYFIVILGVNIDFSAWVINDIPMAFFSLLVTYYSVLFVETLDVKFFYLSLLFVGIGATTKYNEVICIVLPISALLWVYLKKGFKIRKITFFSIFLIPLITFLVIMPFSLLDLPKFLKDVGYEIRLYKATGQKGFFINSGIPNMLFQIGKFYLNIGKVSTLFVIIGIFSLLKKGNGLLRFAFILPVFYFYYMGSTKEIFHRNFLLIYFFIAILFGLGIQNLLGFLKFALEKLKIKRKEISLFIVILLVLVIFIPKTVSEVKRAIKVYNFKDSRTRVVDILNRKRDIDLVIFAKELRVHRNDLRRLKIKYKVIPLKEIYVKKFKVKNVVYVIPSKMTCYYVNIKKMSPFKKLKQKKMIIGKMKKNCQILADIGKNPTNFYIYTSNPEVLVIKRID